MGKREKKERSRRGVGCNGGKNRCLDYIDKDDIAGWRRRSRSPALEWTLFSSELRLRGTNPDQETNRYRETTRERSPKVMRQDRQGSEDTN